MTSELQVTTTTLRSQGTYEWIALDTFSSEDEFCQHAVNRFKILGDPDPELVFLDSDDLPSHFHFPSGSTTLPSGIWEGWIGLSSDDKLIYRHYVLHCKPALPAKLEDAKRRLLGRYETRAQFGHQCWKNSGWIGVLPSGWWRYIDFDEWVADAERRGEFIVGWGVANDTAYDNYWVWSTEATPGYTATPSALFPSSAS